MSPIAAVDLDLAKLVEEMASINERLGPLEQEFIERMVGLENSGQRVCITGRLIDSFHGMYQNHPMGENGHYLAISRAATHTGVIIAVTRGAYADGPWRVMMLDDHPEGANTNRYTFRILLSDITKVEIPTE